MAIGIDCGGTVSTDPATGALECLSTTGAPVAWAVTSAFDPSQLDAGTITAYFSWGYFVVALGWATGKGVGMAVRFIKSL